MKYIGRIIGSGVILIIIIFFGSLFWRIGAVGNYYIDQSVRKGVLCTDVWHSTQIEYMTYIPLDEVRDSTAYYEHVRALAYINNLKKINKTIP